MAKTSPGSASPRWFWLVSRLWADLPRDGRVIVYRDGLAKSDIKLIDRRVRLGYIESCGSQIRLTALGKSELRLPDTTQYKGRNTAGNRRIAETKKQSIPTLHGLDR